MSIWDDAAAEWKALHDQVADARIAVRASQSDAWYRGQGHHEWTLLPKLYRARQHALQCRHLVVAPDDTPEQALKAYVRAFPAAPPGLLECARIAFREANRNREFKRPIGKTRVTRNDLVGIITFSKHVPRSLLSDVMTWIRETVAKSCPQTVLACIRAVEEGDLAELAADFTRWKSLERDSSASNLVSPGAGGLLRRDLSRRLEADRATALQRLRGRMLVPIGEREAFVDYSMRTGRQSGSSWQQLAEMQHHGVPTRLLDWSEAFHTAAFFALSYQYVPLVDAWQELRRDALKEAGSAGNDIPDKDLGFPQLDAALCERLVAKGDRRAWSWMRHGKLLEPCIWVLNPYRLSEIATTRSDKVGKRRIWDMDRNPCDDYFLRVIAERSWPYSTPIPIYTAWNNDRIHAQRGMFTVHGHCRGSIDEQVPEGAAAWRKVRISVCAAIYGAIEIRRVWNMDDYQFFRDRDRLGAKTERRFFGY